MGSNNFFVGDPAPSRAKSSASSNFISPSSHKSWIHIAPTVTSWPYGQSMASSPYILSTENGDFAVMKTANNIFATPISDYRKHGYFSQRHDYGMGTWIDAGTKAKPAMFDEVALPTKHSYSGVYVSFGEKQARFMHGDTYLRKYVTDIGVADLHNNKVGEAFSRIENLRQALVRYYKSSEGQDFYEFLKGEGLDPDEIGYLASVSIHKWVAYAVGRANDGKVIFYANERAFENMNAAAEFYGVKAEDFRMDTIHEEVAHMARRSYDKSGSVSDRVDEEEATKSMVRDFYLLKADENKGTEKGRHYRKMAALMQHNIDSTREIYSEYYSQKQGSLDSLVKSLTAEARRIGADPSEYISNYLATHPAYARKGKVYGKEEAREYNKKNAKSADKEKGRKSNEKEARADASDAEAKEAETDSNKESDSQDGSSEPAGESGGASN